MNDFPIELFVYTFALGVIVGVLIRHFIDIFPKRRGYWALETFDDGYGDYQLYVCSICGNETASRRNFCSNCGADMREES